MMSGCDVLEVACGTGYWSERVGRVSKSLTGIDITQETLDIAKQKNIPNAKFLIGDAFNLNELHGTYNAGIANFWLSHVELDRVDSFIDQFHQKIGKGAVVLIADNVYIDGVGGELIRKDNDENTYKLRKLNDGTEFEVIKNYFTEDQLTNIFEHRSTNLSITMGNCFWWLTYTVS